MRTIYLDSEFKCHVDDDGTMTAVETDFFDGKCNAFIEGYRFVPYGETWTRSDGKVFPGEMIAPWKPYSELDDAQLAYELEQISEYSSALSEIESLLGTPDVSGTIDTIVVEREQAIITKIQDVFTALNTLEVT